VTRPALVGAPPCPKTGHEPKFGFRVSRDGTYGHVPKRQRYRCTDPDGLFHRFTPVLPRELTEGGVCGSCDTHVAAHVGPVVARTYVHRLHLVADVLVAVGRGVSYTRASQRARVAAGRDPLAGEGAGQLAAEWVDVWAPVVVAALAETEQPETLVLDSTEFSWTNPRTHQRRREFAVLVAYGYTATGGKRVWGVRASPTARADDYRQLLADLRLPAPPVSIVSDDDKAIASGVRAAWPAESGAVPYPFLCEHHLRERAKAALTVDNAHAGRGRWMVRLDTAFRRSEGWEEFTAACGDLTNARAWTMTNDARVRSQVAARDQLPAHYSTAAVDAAAHQLRGLFEHRSFAFRNAARTNLLLGLARLHLNNADDPATYHRVLREHAERTGGQPAAPQRGNRDPRDPATHKRTASLR
jgi:hypothetical protein